MNPVWTESLVNRGSATVVLTLSNGVDLRITAYHPHVVDNRRKKPFGYNMSFTGIDISVGHSKSAASIEAETIESMAMPYPWDNHPLMPYAVHNLVTSGLLKEDDKVEFLDACRQSVEKLRQEMERLTAA